MSAGSEAATSSSVIFRSLFDKRSTSSAPFLFAQTLSDRSRIPTAMLLSLYLTSSPGSSQVTTGLMVSPPRAGEESYEEYVLERDAILTSLRRRAVTLSNALNQLEGVIGLYYIHSCLSVTRVR